MVINISKIQQAELITEYRYKVTEELFIYILQGNITLNRWGDGSIGLVDRRNGCGGGVRLKRRAFKELFHRF